MEICLLPHARIPSRLLALIALPVLAVVAGVDASLAQNPPNLRPFVEAGYTEPVHFREIVQGYGFGVGVEMEQSRRLSVLLRAEWNLIQGPPGFVPPPYSFLAYEPPYDATITTLSLGPRFHWLRRGMIRPFVEGSMGVRATNYHSDYGYLGYRPMDLRSIDGLIAQAGVGLTTARYHGAGMSLSARIEAPVDRLGEYLFVPLRIGLVLP